MHSSVRTHTHTHTYIYIYTYIYVGVCVCGGVYVFVDGLPKAGSSASLSSVNISRRTSFVYFSVKTTQRPVPA